jgi:CheY-like chemotaxis protein
VTPKVLLVVDDDPCNIELIRLLVEETGWPVRVEAAANGLQALKLARELAPALVLMDLRMPILDGWEATRRLKADAPTSGIPVVALSAEATPAGRQRALAAGCDEYLVKPVDIRTVNELLERHLMLESREQMPHRPSDSAA